MTDETRWPEPSHITLQNDELIHQVRFRTQNHVINITCICRTKPGETENFSDGSRSLSMIGPTRNIEESRELYNDPSNHWAEFTEEDRAKW